MEKTGNVTVRKRKNGNYEYRFEIEQLDGKRRWKSKGGFTRKKEALAAGEKAREEYLNTEGKTPRKQDNISFNKLSELYLERVLNRLEPTTYSMYKAFFDKYFCPKFGKMPVKDIDYYDVETVLNEMSELNHSQTWIENAQIVLKESFDFAIKPLRIIKENLVDLADMNLHGYKEEEKIPYTRDQINQMLNSIKDDNIYRIIVILGIYCGMRIGEILGLTWDCVDFESMTIRIEKQMANVRYDGKTFQIIKEPKSSSSKRTIHISDTVKSELEKNRYYQKKNEQLRTSTQEEYYYPYIEAFYMGKKKVNRIVNAASIPDGKEMIDFVCRSQKGRHVQSRAVDVFMKSLSKKTGFHTTSHIGRHTHATILLNEGVNIVQISKRLGHNGTGITMHYLHGSEEEDMNMAKRIEDALAVSTK